MISVLLYILYIDFREIIQISERDNTLDHIPNPYPAIILSRKCHLLMTSVAYTMYLNALQAAYTTGINSDRTAIGF